MALLLVLAMAIPGKASAYVDPGSGAMLWQAMAAMLLGLMFYIRRVRVWVGRLFRSEPRQKPKESEVQAFGKKDV